MAIDELPSSLSDLLTYVFAAAFATARISALFFVMPLFTRIRLPGLLRSGLALALVVPVFPMMVNELSQNQMTSIIVLLFLFKEVIVGGLLALVLGVPFWAAEAAGDIVDLQRGSMMGNLIDPSMTYETSITGTLLAIVTIMAFVAAGGLTFTIRMVYESYNIWPVRDFFPSFSENTLIALLDLLTNILVLAITLMYPMIISLIISDIVFAFLARASPHLNIFALSLVVKTLVYCIVFALYASFMLGYVDEYLGVIGAGNFELFGESL